MVLGTKCKLLTLTFDFSISFFYFSMTSPSMAQHDMTAHCWSQGEDSRHSRVGKSTGSITRSHSKRRKSSNGPLSPSGAKGLHLTEKDNALVSSLMELSNSPSSPVSGIKLVPRSTRAVKMEQAAGTLLTLPSSLRL